MLTAGRRGFSLIELLVALVLLELTGIASLAAILTAERIGRRAGAGSEADPERWRRYREAELSRSCSDSNTFRAEPFVLEATTIRPSFEGLLACGR